MPHSTTHITPVTIDEIRSQPLVWQAALNRLDLERPKIASFLAEIQPDEVILTGCGTSYYLPLTAAALYTHCTRSAARGVPASEILTYPDSVFPTGKKYLLVAISRFGKTPETITSARYVKEVLAGRTLAISCAAGTELSEVCDYTVVIPEASEETRFMTRSFSTMLLVWQYLVGVKTGDEGFLKALHDLPCRAAAAIGKWEPFLRDLACGTEFQQYLYLGQGPYYGLACESMLKIKEMACTAAEAYHSMELMHGPRYAVDDNTLITVLLSDGARSAEIELLPKLEKMGAAVCVICDRSTPEISRNADYVVELCSGLSDFARLPLCMPLTQIYGYHRAVATATRMETYVQ